MCFLLGAEDVGGVFHWSLFPVMGDTIKTFRLLAQADRAGALSLAGAVGPRDFKLSAPLGIYSAAR